MSYVARVHKRGTDKYLTRDGRVITEYPDERRTVAKMPTNDALEYLQTLLLSGYDCYELAGMPCETVAVRHKGKVIWK